MPLPEGNGANGVGELKLEIDNINATFQHKIKVEKGYPSVSEMNEGELTIRYLPGQGLYQFVKFNGQLYNSKFSESARPAVNKLIDSTSGSASDRVDTTITNSTTDDISTLAAKINEIIGKL